MIFEIYILGCLITSLIAFFCERFLFFETDGTEIVFESFLFGMLWPLTIILTLIALLKI